MARLSSESLLPGGCVVVYCNRGGEAQHERAVHLELGRRLAARRGLDFARGFDPGPTYTGPL